MDELVLYMNAGPSEEQSLRALRGVSLRTQGHALTLGEGEMRALVRRRTELLRESGRVEFGEGILAKLAFAFCDSPHIAPADFAATLEELLGCFYHFKNECGAALSDDELLDFMKSRFDGEAQGSLEYLSGTLLERLAHNLRMGGSAEAQDEAAQWGEGDDDEA